MYKSNNYHFKAYKSSRREEQKYNDEQQDGLDELLAEQRGEIDSSLKFARMAKRVINSFGEEVLAPPIQKGKINELGSFLQENDLMTAEDINYALKPLASQNTSPAEVAAQNAAQANLDLIALFQQDVKEGRKRQALKDLAQLNSDEDRRLRQNFMNVLQEMKSEADSRSDAAKSKKQFKEDKMILDKMMHLIENQRMHDSFLEFSNITMRDAFANKLQRNLKSALNYKKSMNLVNNFLKNDSAKKSAEITAKINEAKPYTNDMQRRNELESRTRNKAAVTIQQRMAELRARKAAKRRLSNDGTEATDVGSIADLSLRGRPIDPNLAATRLARFQKLEQRKVSGQQLTTAEKKQMSNLQAQLFRKPMALEDKPIHRPQAGRNFSNKLA